MQNENSSDKLGVINGLRGVAILLVIYQHTFAARLIDQFGIKYIIGNGWIGVNLFFILSGFVLFRPYDLGQRHFEKLSDVINFYRHRIARLYPLFILNILVAVAIAGPSMKNVKSAVLALRTLSMVTIDNFFPIINPVLWSLEVEIWFSIIFPILVLLFNRYGVKKVLFGTILFSTLLRFPGAYFEFSNIHLNPIKDNFLTRLDDFVLGCFICHIYYANRKLVDTSSNFYLAFGAILLLVGVTLWDLRLYNDLSRFWVPFLNILLQAGFYFIIIYCLNQRSMGNSILSKKVFQILGLMCYSLYLWHVIFIYLFLSNISTFNYLTYFLILVLTSAMTYCYIEFRRTPNRKLFLLSN